MGQSSANLDWDDYHSGWVEVHGMNLRQTRVIISLLRPKRSRHMGVLLGQVPNTVIVLEFVE